MKLYHGTNVFFDEIDLNKCKPNKDFGQGFYLTSIKSQAKSMAERRCEFTGEGEPVILEYEFNESKLDDNTIKVKIFDGVSEEWARFILENRKSSKKYAHGYDIVIGPVADDGVVLQINLFLRKIIDIKTLVEALKYRKLINMKTALYLKSPEYIYEYLKEEIGA